MPSTNDEDQLRFCCRYRQIGECRIRAISIRLTRGFSVKPGTCRGFDSLRPFFPAHALATRAHGDPRYSAARCAPFSAAERRMRRTRKISTNATVAEPQNTSKYESDAAC